MFHDEDNFWPLGLSGCFPVLEDVDLLALDKMISRVEVFQTLKQMGSFKAPRPDGFQPVFYQNQWKVVGDDLFNLVSRIFENPSQVRAINDTLITLIPKKDVMTTMKDFHPISLCNVSYKVITKIISHRLHGMMGKLVGPCQSSFVPRRQSGDNIIIAQEIFHSLRKKSGKIGLMAIKVDLEKAYDRLKWDFIRDTLQDIGIPGNLVNLIWHCISTPTMRMLWNGETLESFIPSRGIRQGDPLSPYLFVLYIERLFQMISLAVDYKYWKPICLNRVGPKLSHLAFASDLLLFAEVSLKQVQVFQHIMEAFCRSFGQKISRDKSRVFFSKNVGWQVKQQLSDALGIQWIEDLGKYLGVPILHKRASKETYNFILEKVTQRLSSWKSRNLSFAGRVTLTKSVLQALPTYAMQTVNLPMSVCEEVDKICRGFI